jgi:leucine dehydrogenase
MSGPGASSSIDGLMEIWQGEAVVSRYDRPTGTWIFIALHDTSLGPAVGGCRMHTYPAPHHGLRDAMRLAEGMTYKWAGIGFPFGGGKSVLAVSRILQGPEREGLLRRFGGLLNVLRGGYVAGEDLGTTPEDMSILAEETPYVHARPGELLDPGPYTALGVFAGIESTVAHTGANAGEIEGLRVLVQGVGDVGAPLARMLAERGARLLLCDLDMARASSLADEIGGEVVVAEEAYGRECDVYAPCAVGATLNPGTVEELACAIVAGSANNQLDSPRVADRLAERGIVYVPDYIVNAGGAIALPLVAEGASEERIRERVLQVGATVSDILRRAQQSGATPAAAADARVRETLDRAARGELQLTVS